MAFEADLVCLNRADIAGKAVAPSRDIFDQPIIGTELTERFPQKVDVAREDYFPLRTNLPRSHPEARVW